MTRNAESMKTAPRQCAGWRLLLAAVAAVFVTLLGAGIAFATTVPNLETRVGASTPAGQVVVGVAQHIAAGQRLGNAPLGAEVVVATGVADRLGLRVGDAPARSGVSRPVVGDAVAAKSGTPLYRGVTEGHHAFDEALQGTAMPGDLLGHSDGVLHSAGMTENSILTSWTTDRAAAERFATNGASKRGVILETTLEQQAYRTVQGLDLGESEVLLRGIVTGCRVSGCG